MPPANTHTHTHTNTNTHKHTHTQTHTHHTTPHTNTHTPHHTPHAHTVFWESAGILTKCVGKILQNSINIPAMSAFKEVYQICTDDYDNNEYLAVKYIRFFANDII